MINIDLKEGDILEHASLSERISSSDLCDSQDMPISVCYNEIDMGGTQYGFNQPFEGDEANLYFQRMNEFSKETINSLVDNGPYQLHFNRTDVCGNIKKVFNQINPNIVKANPLIFHFALDTNNHNHANRATNVRNPRIYFMVGYSGMIHTLFFDPYHELNPIK